jgi:hypothetical protein
MVPVDVHNTVLSLDSQNLKPGSLMLVLQLSDGLQFWPRTVNSGERERGIFRCVYAEYD